MRLFEVQDSLLLLDFDPLLQFDKDAKKTAREVLNSDFGSLIVHAEKHLPQSKLFQFLKVSQNIEMLETSSCVESNDYWKVCRSLALGGYAPAAFLLYYLYDTGEFGHPKDSEKSKQFESLACKLNHPQALWNKGIDLMQCNRDLGKRFVVRSAMLGFDAAIRHIRAKKDEFGDFEKNICALFSKYDF